MITDWYKETVKCLKKDEAIEKSYRVEFEDQEGYISLTDHRLIFIQVQGFIKKKYNKTLDLPYSDIIGINHEGSNTFTLIGTNNRRYLFSSFGVPASQIEESIEYYRLNV